MEEDSHLSIETWQTICPRAVFACLGKRDLVRSLRLAACHNGARSRARH